MGQIDASLNDVVSQIISNINCGSLTGCVEGHGPFVSKVPEAG